MAIVLAGSPMALLLMPLLLAVPAYSQSKQPWLDVKHQAQSLETQGQPQKAAAAYEQAFSLLPPADEAESAILELSATLNFLRAFQYDKSFAHGFHAAKTVAHLRDLNKLDDNIEIAVEQVTEHCQAELRSDRRPDPRRKHDDDVYRLYQALLASSHIERAKPLRIRHGDIRVLIASLKDDKALVELEKLIKTISPTNPEYLPVLLEIAALKNKHGQPQPLQKARQAMLQKFDSCDVACAIVRAQIWAADYDAAVVILDAETTKLKQSKKYTLKRESNLEASYTEVYADRGDLVKAVEHRRKLVALLSQQPDAKVQLREAIKYLASELRSQHKYKEADAVAKKMDTLVRPDLEFMLTDEEQAALRKTGHKSK